MVKSRSDTYKEIKDALGIVPSFFNSVPDNSLELEWHLMMRVQMEEGPIPNKYRELIGVGLAAITRCPYCIYFHTEMAKLNGATEAEIEDAVHFAKSSAGWSTYLNGMQVDLKQFKGEVQKICTHVMSSK